LGTLELKILSLKHPLKSAKLRDTIRNFKEQPFLFLKKLRRRRRCVDEKTAIEKLI
jgi:hypothetical protein